MQKYIPVVRHCINHHNFLKSMIGTWKGYYKYDNKKAQKILGSDLTYFTIVINSFIGNKFIGTVKDEELSGGMEDEGQIIGEIENTKVSFKKLMPRTALVYKDGSRKYFKKKHPPIYYTGMIALNGKQ